MTGYDGRPVLRRLSAGAAAGADDHDDGVCLRHGRTIGRRRRDVPRHGHAVVRGDPRPRHARRGRPMTVEAAERGGENGTVSLRACPYRARAWRDDRLVADSTSALRDEGADRAPVLWFPVADVHGDLLDDGAALTRGAGELDGFVAFDAERVRIELVNSADRAADHPIVRFPNWGDAADLIDMIDVRSIGDGRYVSVPRADWRRPVVEGSQMLGQMVVAAMRETGGRRAVSASIVLIRAADAASSVDVRARRAVPRSDVLDRVGAGGTE